MARVFSKFLTKFFFRKSFLYFSHIPFCYIYIYIFFFFNFNLNILSLFLFGILERGRSVGGWNKKIDGKLFIKAIIPQWVSKIKLKALVPYTIVE